MLYIILGLSQQHFFKKEWIMNAETQKAFDDFYVALSPLARSIKRKLIGLQGNIEVIQMLPLPERILAWKEWDRLCRPPLIVPRAVNPHTSSV